MIKIEPSFCTISGRDTVDCILDALSAILTRPLWLLKSALLPALCLLVLKSLQSVPALAPYFESILGITVSWALLAVAFLPSVLAWSRVGFDLGPEASSLILYDRRGFSRGLDLLVIILLCILSVALLSSLLLSSISNESPPFFPVRWLMIFAAAVVIMPALILGGMRLLITLPAAALGWNLSYAQALVLTSARTGWLAGIGVAFICMFPLTWQGVAGLRGMVNANMSVPDMVWPWVNFFATVLLCAVAGHGLGQVLRRLLEGIPVEDDETASAREEF